MSSPKPGVQERILLHLRDYVAFSESVEVPFALSQMGIANAVAIARSNVPRAISGLKEQGLLIEKQAHVHGVMRKRKSYFLTTIGSEVAEETWNRLSQHNFEILLPDERRVKTELGTCNEKLPFPIRPVDILRYLRDDGVLDISKLSPELIERDLTKRVEKQLSSSLGDLPRLRHFFGRDTEIDGISEILDSGSNAILIPGIAGIGKTSLAAKLLEKYTFRRNLIYHRCQLGAGGRPFLEDLGGWLSSVGVEELNDYLEASPVPRIDETVELLVSSLKNVSALIVIDDYHKNDEDIFYKIIYNFVLRINEMNNELGLVIFSRSYRPVLPLRNEKGQNVSKILPLDGLDPDASKNILDSFKSISDDEYKRIYGISKGHPLVLELINRGASTIEHNLTLENYVSMEIFDKLSAEEKRLLQSLSIFREPVPLEALTDLDLDLNTLDNLVEQGLARRVDSENYDVHDLIREFTFNGIDEQVAIPLHTSAAKWYKKKLNSQQDLIEYLHHKISYADSEIAAEEVAINGDELINNGQLELLGLINRLIDSKGNPKIWGKLWYLRGKILFLSGDFGGSEASFTVGMNLANQAKDINLESILLSNLAELAWKRGDSSTALDLHRQALKRFIATKDSIGACNTYTKMSYIFRSQGKKQLAMDAHSEVEHILSTEVNPELIYSRINLARSYLEMGELELGRKHALTAFDSTQNEDEITHSRARAVLGRYYALIGDTDLALNHYLETLQSLSNRDDVEIRVELIILMGEVLEDSGKRDEAVERYLEGLALAESSNQPLLVGELLSRLGSTGLEKQRRMEYLQRALNVFREVGATRKMQEVQMMFHKAITGN